MPKLVAHCAVPIAIAFAASGVPVLAQDTRSEDPVDWTWDQSDSQTPKTWHVMISIEQAVGPRGCDTYRYKVSTIEPITIKGPPEVRGSHADELAAWWMMHVRHRAPTAYRWLTTSVGHEPPQVYFRESAKEVREAFREDGHLRKSRSCSGSVLVGLRTSGFKFTAPPGFATTDFGSEPVPQGVTVARELPTVPGAR